MHLKCSLIGLIILLGACSSTTQKLPPTLAAKSPDLIIFIDWIGAVSKPYPAICLASKSNSKKKEAWLADGLARSGRDLSAAECARLLVLFQNHFFVTHRHETLHDRTIESEQYLMLVSHNQDFCFYTLGDDQNTQKMLTGLSRQLEPDATALFNPLFHRLGLVLEPDLRK